MFKVSVIIPVYNAEKYIERAIKSIIGQTHVGEVIVIDDGYRDGALDKCLSLQDEFANLKVMSHPNHENLGAGATRNLGIEYAQFDYISFLDADDYALQDRFVITEKRFSEHKDAIAVYEPIGVDFLSEEAKQQFAQWKNVNLEQLQDYITYPTFETKGEDFFESLLTGAYSYPHIIGITVKTDFLKKHGYFDPALRLHQDTDWLIRLAHKGCFVPGDKNHKVANRFVHGENRILKQNFGSRYLQSKKLLQWAREENIGQPYFKQIKDKYLIARIRKMFNSDNFLVKLIYKMLTKIL